MARFFIEVPHEAERIACARAIQILLQSGSHFVTHAEYGCGDGVHKAWIMVDMESKEAARGIIPPAYRSQAKIVQLTTFTLQEINDILRHHGE